jgi:hypothetical protein
MGIKWEDRFEQLGHLEESQLLHLARNEAASVEYRLTAVEIMLKKGHNSVNHPDLVSLKRQITDKSEPIEVEHESEIAHVETSEEDNSGPFKASVTTETLFSDDNVQKIDEFTPANEAQDQTDTPLTLTKD